MMVESVLEPILLAFQTPKADSFQRFLTISAACPTNKFMSKEAPIDCSVITPEKQVLSTPASAVVFPAHDGLVGILQDRAPLLCELGTGVMRVDVPGGPSKQVFIDAGFAQVLDNQVTILTERAALAEDIHRADAEKELAAAERMPTSDEASIAERQKAIERAKAQISIAKK